MKGVAGAVGAIQSCDVRKPLASQQKKLENGMFSDGFFTMNPMLGC